MVKYLFLFFVLISCVSIKHNRNNLLRIQNVMNQDIKLKLDGFYYVENLSDVYSIDVLLLYKDGLIVNDGSFNGLSSNYCLTNTKKENSIENSIENYKSRLNFLKQSNKTPLSCKILENDLDGKGVFFVHNDSIIIQYFKSDFKIKNKDSFNDYFLHEYRGIILNDTLFKILKVVNYRNNLSKDVELVFKFMEHPHKPKLNHKKLLNNIY